MGKKHKQNTHHEYISIKQEHTGIKFRVFNYAVLLSMVLIDRYVGFSFTSIDYAIVFCAIVGFDIPAIQKLIFDRLFAKVKTK